MIGIPKKLATKRDIENLHILALDNTIDRKEWIKKLEEISQETTFDIIIMEKTDTGFIVPLIDLPSKYDGISEKIKYKDSEELNAWNIKEIIEENYITISKGYLNLEELGVTHEYVQTKLRELV